MAFLSSRSYRRKSRSGAGGQAILEFLPVVVLLLTVTFSVIDVSRAIWQMEVLSALSREGSDIASRSLTLTPTADAATTIMNDGANVQLSTNGAVIVTQVENVSGSFIIQQQTEMSYGKESKVRSRVGTGVGKTAKLPTVSPTIPAPGTSVYVTEVFSSYSPITPIGGFAKLVLPSTLYDIAYF